MRRFLLGFSMWSAATLAVAAPSWSVGESLPAGGRSNPYELDAAAFDRVNTLGRSYAVDYPVPVSDTVYPLAAFFRGFDNGVFRTATGYASPDEAYAWLGLPPFPDADDQGVYSVPLPSNAAERRLGAAYQQREGLPVLTYGCPACHSGSLFGKTVLGLSTRFPRANEFFLRVKSATTLMPAAVWQTALGASDAERIVYQKLGASLRAVETVKPQALGLDASIAQVSLSLSRRADDADATRSAFFELLPRADGLRHHVADSKPPVWWNVRYKNRWAADGSLVAGNPILTNLLWNEVGRGTPMPALGHWVDEHPEAVQALTTAVFASSAPLYSDFFAVDAEDVAVAKRGEPTFDRLCSGCHGTYAKAWADPSRSDASPAELFKTRSVAYPQPTRVVDVGTDPLRWQGMAYLAPKLNALRFSREHGVVVEATRGYVPPPLTGIWARWPYFHNNSAPTLCDVLTAAADRPKSYRAVPADDPATDFDDDCNGYPRDARSLGDEYVYDGAKPGLAASGHDEGIFRRHGVELLTPAQKHELIKYLQSL